MNLFNRINFLNGSNAPGEYLLALDIGTEFVKALVFKADLEKEEGEVVGVGKVRQKAGDMQAAAVADIDGVTETCRQAIGEAYQMSKQEPKKVIVGIAGEYVRGAATTVSHTRQKPQDKIDLPELKNIVQKAQWQAFNSIRQKLSEEINVSEIDVKLINAAIVGVKVDGYQVTNPLGFVGRGLDLTIFDVYAPLVHLGAIESIINSLKLDLLSIAAEPYAIARSVNLGAKQTSPRGNAIIVDIGGGTSDMALIKNGSIEGVKSLAIGGQAFTKRLASVLGLSFKQAEEVKIKYSQGEVGRLVKKKITETFKKDLKIWSSGLALILEDFSQTSSLPGVILLCGGGSFLPGIEKSLGQSDWLEKLPFGDQKPEVAFINPEDIENMRDSTGLLKTLQDVAPMSLASLALEIKRDKDTTMGSIIKRTVRLMQS